MMSEVREESVTGDETTRLEQPGRKRVRPAIEDETKVARKKVKLTTNNRTAAKEQIKRALGAVDAKPEDVKFILHQARYFHLIDAEDLEAVEPHFKRLGKVRVPAYDIMVKNNCGTGQPLTLLPYDIWDKTKAGFISRFANVVWGSKLFFISGLGPQNCICTRDVLSFDMEKQTWDRSWSPIGRERCCHIAVGVSDMIYVFGNVPQRPIKKKFWGEVFNITTNEWRFLPEPPELLHDLQMPRAYSIYYKCKKFTYNTKDGSLHSVPRNQNLILFPLYVKGSPISVFNCTEDTWLPDLYPKLPTTVSIFPSDIMHSSDRLAVVDGVLLWHYGEAIHGYDFLNNKYLESLFEIPPSRRHFDDHYDYPHQPPMFLIQPDKEQKLFFIFQYQCDPHSVHCYEFLVQVDPCVSLVQQSYSRLSTKATGHTFLQNVLSL